jgi:hypothetical protein
VVQVDGVRRFNTGVALNPLFEILKSSALNKQQDGDIVVRQAQTQAGRARAWTCMLHCGGLNRG